MFFEKLNTFSLVWGRPFFSLFFAQVWSNPFYSTSIYSLNMNTLFFLLITLLLSSEMLVAFKASPTTALFSKRFLSSSTSLHESLFDFTVKDAKGAALPLSSFKGKKAILIVNVASKWGLTRSNYEELVALYSKYSKDGLEIIAFPCNSFGAQG